MSKQGCGKKESDDSEDPAPPQVRGLPWDGDTLLAGGPIVPSAVPTAGWDRTESLLSVVKSQPRSRHFRKSDCIKGWRGSS